MNFFAILGDHVYVLKILGRSLFYGFWIGTIKHTPSIIPITFVHLFGVYKVLLSTYRGFPGLCMTHT